MANKTEFQIGEEFQCGLVRLKCVKELYPNALCDKCYFEAFNHYEDVIGSCSKQWRDDETNVIFVKVEK